MGNRAIIAIAKGSKAPAIYVHWNGGPESVLAFLKAAEQLGVRSPENDPSYCLARLGQIICNFVGGHELSVGFGLAGEMDDGDNGVYTIGPGFEIKSRSRPGPTTVASLDLDDQHRFSDILAEVLKSNGASAP